MNPAAQIAIGEGDSLIVVDIQSDFLPGVRAVDARPGDGRRALEQMVRLGARPLEIGEIAA